MAETERGRPDNAREDVSGGTRTGSGSSSKANIGSILTEDAYDLFEAEREGAPGNIYFGRVREILAEDALEYILQTIKNIDMLLAKRIPVEVVERSLEAPIHLYKSLPYNEIAVTRGKPASGRVAEIRFNANRKLTQDQFVYTLMHELRHVMQNEAGIDLAGDPELTYEDKPIEIDANQFAQAVTNLPLPQYFSG